MPFRRSFPLLLLLACLMGGIGQFWLLWLSQIPLGIPEEWTWARARFETADLWNLLPAMLVGAGYLWFVWRGSASIERTSLILQTPAGQQTGESSHTPAQPPSLPSVPPSPRPPSPRTAAWLAGLCLGGFLWMLALLAAVPGIGGLSRLPFVLYYPRTSGYFWQARYEVDDLGRFLAEYRESISDSDDPDNYLHIGTHPPGLTTGYRLLIDACERRPWLVRFAEATQPPSVREAFEILRRNEQRAGRQFRPADRAALWWGALGTLLAAAAVSGPLFLLLREKAGPRAAWWGAALWPLLPAVTVFLPKSDLLFPLLAVLMQWQWLESLDRGSLRQAIVAGTLFAFAMLLSLAFIPLLAIFALQFGIRFLQGERRWRCVAGAVLPLGVMILASAVWLDLNLPAVWYQNFLNHAAFYDHNPRTWWAWMLVIPVELAVAVGLPVAMLSLAGLVRVVSMTSVPGIHRDLLAAVAVWLLLWLSGKNMGEAARLWIFLMPCLLWLSASACHGRARRASGVNQPAETPLSRTMPAPPDEGSSRLWWLSITAMQMVVCLLTTIRIDGFHFEDLLH
jgi:methylthioxylose transferase